MTLMCRLGKHRLGPPRLDESGATTAECLVCLRVVPTRVALGASAEQRADFEQRRARAVAELVAAKRWAGSPTDAPLERSPERSPLRLPPPAGR